MIILGFEYFHPLNDEHPNTFPEYGKDIIARARKLVNKRTVEEVFLVIGFINWLIAQSPAKEESIKQLYLIVQDGDNSKEPNEEELHLLERDLDTSTYALKAFQAKFSLPSLENVPNLLWSEIFAVLTLSLIDKAIDDEKHYGKWGHEEHPDWLYEWRILSHSSYWLIEAMDAVATAEGFKSSEDHIISSKEKISIQNTSAAIKRHAKTSNAVLALNRFINEGRYKSTRNATQIFCEKFPEQVDHLSPYNAVRTLSEALSKYLAGQRRSLQKS